MASVRVSPKSATWAVWILGSALSFWILSGCNVFTPLASDSGDDLSYRGLILKGNEAINDKNYPKAADYFKRAMVSNPRGSEAYLYHSKALINQYGIDYNSLNTEFECKRPSRDRALCLARGIDSSGIPFVDSATSMAGIDSIYYPVATAVRNLEHILRKSKDTIPLGGSWKMYPDGDTAGDGRISDGVARLDLGLLQAVKAMLAPLDLDGNDRIDLICGRNVCPDQNAPCLASAAYKEKCKEGPTSEVKRFESFKKLTRRVSLDNIDSKDVNARNVSTNPNDINAFLDAMQGPVAGSNYNLDSVTGAMDSHNEQKMSGQLSGIVGNINDLNNFLSYMRYNDGLDNDMDDRKGLIKDSLFVWHDFDKEAGIRYDYSDSSRFRGYPEQSGNIGHPVHRHLRGAELYQTFAEWSKAYPVINSDTSKNSRKALMIKHCKDHVTGYPETGNVTALLKATIMAVTCTTYSTLLKPGAPRPALSDWVAGVPGIDEEMVDERDNDYDGLKDEDARNARGMDDDDDALLSILMVGNPAAVIPMQWAEAAGSTNRCPDIDKNTVLPYPRQRQFCVGSLEHRIHLALTYGAGSTDPAVRRVAEDTLNSYYSQFTGTENGPHANCLEDFEKLDKAYRDEIGLEVTSQVVRTACKFKHIWIHGTPPNSEWTAGIFGVDEEILDGVDNDGDGWIDEDLK